MRHIAFLSLVIAGALAEPAEASPSLTIGILWDARSRWRFAAPVIG